MEKTRETLKREFMENLEQNYNCSWAEMIRKETEEHDRWDKIALFYRGNKITYREMFLKAHRYVAGLKHMGITKGTRVPVCMSHCPEEIYLLLALSYVGAIADVFGEKFDKDYIEERIESTGSRVLFMTDDKYEELSSVSRDAGIDKIVMFSLTDSYPHGKNPYNELESGFYHGKNLVPHYAVNDDRIYTKDEFEDKCSFFYTSPAPALRSFERVDIDDIFTITYSSGSTNSHRPKPIVHKVRTYNAMALAHTCGDFPSIKGLTSLVHIPSHSNTCILSSISDALFQGYTCALEYIYDERFFPISLQINKPSQVVATRSHWLRCFKEYDTNPKFRNVDLKFLLTPFSVGEGTSAGEEKFINRKLRQYKAGTKFTKVPFTTLGMAGGDCEHSGIFILPFKAWMDKNPKKLIRKEETGYSTYRMVDVAILDDDGNVIMTPNIVGNLSADSPCTMARYDNDEEATKKFFVKDKTGRERGLFGMDAYIDRYGKIHLLGRKSEKKELIPTWAIQNVICRDTKNIMSCEVVYVDGFGYVAHIELQPERSYNITEAIISAEKRLSKQSPTMPQMFYKVHSYDDGFPLTGCGKRDFNKLKAMGIKSTLVVKSISSKEQVLYDGERYAKEKGLVKSLTLEPTNNKH